MPDETTVDKINKVFFFFFPCVREDAAYSQYPCFFPYNHTYSVYDQLPDFPPQYYGIKSAPMHMMAPQFAPVNSLQLDPPASSTSQDLSSAARKKKTRRWTETEEKVLNELFGENKEKLRYKAYNLPEWESIAKQLHERCRREHVSSDMGVVNATGVARTHIKKFKRRISNSLDHERIILLSIEVFNLFVDRHCF